MELIDSEVDPGLVFEKVDDFKYLDATLSTINDWEKEINTQLNFYALGKNPQL